MKILALIEDTLRSRSTTIIVFLSIATFFLLIGVIIAILVDPSSLLQQPAQSGGATQQQGTQGGISIDLSSMPQLIRFFEAGLAGFVQFAALLLAVFATAGIIPSTLEKGTIDLFLSKPVSRVELLGGRFLGSVFLVFAITAYFIFGAWLIISLKTGYWDPAFLTVILTVTVNFAIMYTVMMALGISTRSSAATIIIVFFYMYILAPILSGRETGLFAIISNESIRAFISGIYYFLPKPGEIGSLAGAAILGYPVTWMPVPAGEIPAGDAGAIISSASWMPLWSSAIFGVATYALSMYLLKNKDF